MTAFVQQPILYSLKNCPYAMRARLAIYTSGNQVRLREVSLKNKPSAMLSMSAKGTVPVLVLSESRVIDESIQIMRWAFENSCNDALGSENSQEYLNGITKRMIEFDTAFIPCLEAYRSAKRYHDATLLQTRQACEVFIQELESQLTRHQFLLSNTQSLLDLAVLPFIRQFSRVERQWYLQSPYPNLRRWLQSYLQSQLFSKVMVHQNLWLDTKEELIFGQ
ncbi:glutathione S-transferase [Shewanella gelidii]|uniref:Glutathione S-transferase n=1 Tax=Shewanella gelidii TaxID=1642821 RepID=A0A917NBG3_9GAMM|nr:glutathione S-transferase [Shewanella gelidii]MCL1098047.1 glutathione S-transferase [Shewanella gelidii]GGI85734.1 glutathione S-transferase [Shewanella gelidii]